MPLNGEFYMGHDVTDFEAFWAAYPRKTAKGSARKAWEQLSPDAALVERMLDAVTWQRRQPQWLQQDGDFIPYPATWIRAERWDDEPFQAAPLVTPTNSRHDQTLRDIQAGKYDR